LANDRFLVFELAAQIVIASIEGGLSKLDDIPPLLKSVIEVLDEEMQSGEFNSPIKPVPAVNVKRSVTSDYIICLEDGKKFKSMRAHLRKIGMTPSQYRQKWGLPNDYPIVAPNYAASRSTMAKLSGLGSGSRRRSKLTEPKTPDAR